MTEIRLVAPHPRPAPPLTEAQRAAVDHSRGALLVMGGPGTGKTTAATAWVRARLESSPVVLTASRRAALAMAQAVGAEVPPGCPPPRISSFHSFCLALWREHAPVMDGDSEPRLLTAPEQEAHVREILAGRGAAAWPSPLRPAVGTATFAKQLRGLLAHARRLGMEPEDLVSAGRRSARAEWSAAGEFFAEYLNVLDLENAIDYPELMHRCRLLVEDDAITARVRQHISALCIDDLHECDISQVAILRRLAQAVPLTAFADPDAAVDRFRGAQVRSLVRFFDDFSLPGQPARVQVWGQGLRLGPELTAAAVRVADRLPALPGLDGAEASRLRQLAPAAHPDEVSAFTSESESAQAAHVADLLRRAHVHDGMAWDRMAVIVRTGAQMAPLSRALAAAGIPVEGSGDAVGLARELAVMPLLAAAELAVGLRSEDESAIRQVATSALGGFDARQWRVLGRQVREVYRATGDAASAARPSGELASEAVMGTLPVSVAERLPSPEADRAARLGEMLRAAGEIARSQGTAHEIVWELWSHTDWPRRLRREALRGGPASGAAHRDLEAVMTLFRLAERRPETGPSAIANLVDEVARQEIPGDITREGDVGGRGVRLVTAHRAKGGEWDLVIVAGVQEGAWPTIRPESSLLGADQLTIDGAVPPEPASARLADERRLFRLACTRARRRLVVCAVDGTEGEGDAPSRFLAELGTPATSLSGRPRRPLTAGGLVAELRRCLVDPEASPAVRDAAARRLARLMSLTDDRGRPLAPSAAPQRWWGTRVVTSGGRGWELGEPVELSPSGVEALLRCPRRWFLDTRARAQLPDGGARALGTIIHRLAEEAAQTGVDPVTLSAHIADVWHLLPHGAEWLSDAQRVAAESALARMAAWQDGQRGRRLIGVEVPFEVVLDLGGPVRIRGKADRLELNADGGLVIVDLKTGKAPTAKEVARMPQLGIYQLAAIEGAFAPLASGSSLAGAEAVYLMQEDPKKPGHPVVRTQPSLAAQPWPGEPVARCETWVHAEVAAAAEEIREQEYPARRHEWCRSCPFATSCPASGLGKQVVA